MRRKFALDACWQPCIDDDGSMDRFDTFVYAAAAASISCQAVSYMVIPTKDSFMLFPSWLLLLLLIKLDNSETEER